MKILKRTLGEIYDGPSIGFEDGKFVLYRRHNDPFDLEVLVADETWSGFIRKLRTYEINKMELI